jgi:SagB-type dehydrogenase family enzyme
MLPFEDSTSLSALYHLNSEPWMNLEAYNSAVYSVEYKEFPDACETVPLPEPETTPLQQIVRARFSCREYTQDVMPLETLATVLVTSYGIVRTGRIQGGAQAFFRTTPSAGGLFPLELYVSTQRVSGLKDGLYHFAVGKRKLELLKTASLSSEAQGALLIDPFVREANVVVFLSAVFERTQHKYGPRGYRYILLEAGHVAQNICLLAAEKGLGSLCMGGFVDSKLNRFLGLDGRREAVVYAVGVGYAKRLGQ